MEFSETLVQETMKKLTYKSKKPPSRKTCRSRIEFAATIISNIAKDPTLISAKFALEIIKASEVYLKNAIFITMDKLILKILNKVFIPEMIDYIRNLDDPEILAGLCCVKYKHLLIVDERIFCIYNRLNCEMRHKVQKYFGNIIIEYEKAYTHSNVCEYTLEDVQSSIFSLIYPKEKVWNDFSGYKNFQYFSKEIDMFKKILIVIEMIEECRLKDARRELLVLIDYVAKDLKLVIYNLISYIHFLSLEFQEAIVYLNLLLELAAGFDWEFGFNCKLFLERLAMIPSLCPFVSVDFSELKNMIGSDEKLISKYFENKFVIRDILAESMQRITLYNKTYCTKRQIKMFFNGLKNVAPEYTILFIFSDKDRLYVYNAADSELSMRIEWKSISNEFEEIMLANRDVLSMNVVTVEDKKHWWSTRIKLDQSLEELFKKLRSMIDLVLNERIMFILDDSVSFFPFESVFEKPAFRILSHDFSFQSLSLDVNSIFYLLDPANNLQNTRKTILEYFGSKNLNGLLKGVVGRVMKPEEVKDMSKTEIFMYFGHGSGKKYFDFSEKKPSALFLFGCSSCKLLNVENFKSNGFCLKHLKKNRVVLGNLWDVTDKDLDKYTMAVLEDLFREKDIVESVSENKSVCKLKYLNSSALVLYGNIKSIKIKNR